MCEFLFSVEDATSILTTKLSIKMQFHIIFNKGSYMIFLALRHSSQFVFCRYLNHTCIDIIYVICHEYIYIYISAILICQLSTEQVCFCCTNRQWL